ncbi:uncharacterized protein BT62DRAFT_1012032 [Guyanagaster necrorhizus]|uniref:Uncharacterized protein n=1 Tax=Guyanagaster necrorhizus TaxID=856835 RepID=A0A9P8AMK4_9AGAR|nr:uncharacterized protein BT62DRAFT_1012032 [Guyanagaster necrorhizus MCA 3950]KAG7441005.1 hypothetical protein BT62DRAFT_1012032 [Guyanagaster necrorhizus MCA 3950]
MVPGSSKQLKVLWAFPAAARSPPQYTVQLIQRGMFGYRDAIEFFKEKNDPADPGSVIKASQIFWIKCWAVFPFAVALKNARHTPFIGRKKMHPDTFKLENNKAEQPTAKVALPSVAYINERRLESDVFFSYMKEEANPPVPSSKELIAIVSTQCCNAIQDSYLDGGSACGSHSPGAIDRKSDLEGFVGIFRSPPLLPPLFNLYFTTSGLGVGLLVFQPF